MTAVAERLALNGGDRHGPQRRTRWCFELIDVMRVRPHPETGRQSFALACRFCFRLVIQFREFRVVAVGG
jgi:hypothetical protein